MTTPAGRPGAAGRGVPRSVWVCLAAVWAATGTNFLAFKVAVADVPTFALTAMRLGIAALPFPPAALLTSPRGLGPVGAGIGQRRAPIGQRCGADR